MPWTIRPSIQHRQPTMQLSRTVPFGRPPEVEVDSVDERRGHVRRVLIIAGASVGVLIGAASLYVFVNLDEARALQTVAEAARLCKQALAASADATCSSLLADRSRDPWGR